MNDHFLYHGTFLPWLDRIHHTPELLTDMDTHHCLIAYCSFHQQRQSEILVAGVNNAYFVMHDQQILFYLIDTTSPNLISHASHFLNPESKL